MIRFLASATFMRRSNGLLALAWLILVPVTLATGSLQRSITFLVFMSLWANIAGHWSGWAAGVIATKQENDADVQDVLDRMGP